MDCTIVIKSTPTVCLFVGSNARTTSCSLLRRSVKSFGIKTQSSNVTACVVSSMDMFILQRSHLSSAALYILLDANPIAVLFIFFYEDRFMTLAIKKNTRVNEADQRMCIIVSASRSTDPNTAAYEGPSLFAFIFVSLTNHPRAHESTGRQHFYEARLHTIIMPVQNATSR